MSDDTHRDMYKDYLRWQALGMANATPLMPKGKRAEPLFSDVQELQYAVSDLRRELRDMRNAMTWIKIGLGALIVAQGILLVW